MSNGFDVLTRMNGDDVNLWTKRDCWAKVRYNEHGTSLMHERGVRHE